MQFYDADEVNTVLSRYTPTSYTRSDYNGTGDCRICGEGSSWEAHGICGPCASKLRPGYQACGHIRPFLSGPRVLRTAEGCVKALTGVEFEAVAYRGNSGALIAPTVAALMSKDLILVRKKDDDTHSSLNVEGPSQAVRYVIVDDFVDSGSTVNTIVKAVKNLNPDSKPVGLVEYTYLAQPERAEHPFLIGDEMIPRYSIRVESLPVANRPDIVFDNGSTVEVRDWKFEEPRSLTVRGYVTGRTSSDWNVVTGPIPTREEQEKFIAENGYGNLAPDSDLKSAVFDRYGWRTETIDGMSFPF
jgi:hypothetical protein